MKDILIYNTLTRKKEKFEPVNKGEVRMYVCGITPYGKTHLGHARCYVVFDVFKRFFECLGYNVRYIQNVTDIDDKIINKSRKTKKPPLEIAEKYFKDFLEVMEVLNVLPADEYPKVSHTIKDIIRFVQGLIEKNMAYHVDGNVYFRVSKISEYGKLSRRDPEELLSSQEMKSEQKSDPRDFALWKKDEEFGWSSPWGKGRPGWHIECSAMAKKYLGERFDIHGGGRDLVFPHHENEIVQSKSLTGKDPAKYWLHNGMVKMKGDKMAKSTGNFFILRDLLKEFNPMVVRMYLLMSNYRQDIDFDLDSLKDTNKAYNKMLEFKKEVSELDKGYSKEIGVDERDSVLEALSNDLNTAGAIGEIFKKTTPILERIFKNKVKEDDILKGKKLINYFEQILGIKLEIRTEKKVEEIEELVNKREKLRKNKKYKQADKIRNQLNNLGIEVKDTPSGPKWFQKKS
ncbi:MAG: cysteine--tRNA ligase [Elusimicrobiota bacterium]